MQTERSSVESNWFLACVNLRPYYVAMNDIEVVTFLCEGPRHNLPGLRCDTDAFGEKVLLPCPFLLSATRSLNARD
jgi:hypothetical protein